MGGVLKYRLLFTSQKNFPQLTRPGRVYAYLRLRAADRSERPRKANAGYESRTAKEPLICKRLRFCAERPCGLQSEGK